MTTASWSVVRRPQVEVLSEMPISERVVLMRASALFTGLSEEQCWEIASWARTRNFARDELLFMQGQPVHSLMLIQAGSVKLTQLGSNGNEVILWMNGEGDAVDERADGTPHTHSCSARAMEQCRALSWEYNRLQNLLMEYPQIRKNINLILSGRLRELEQRFRVVATEKVAKRLAFTLLQLLKVLGKHHERGVQVSLSREELAQMTGTTLFTISRILSKWADEGFVLPCREAVVIRDPQRLGQLGDEVVGERTPPVEDL